jgi:hypothetical protein
MGQFYGFSFGHAAILFQAILALCNSTHTEEPVCKFSGKKLHTGSLALCSLRHQNNRLVRI